jgi:predicted small secreted protein
MRTALVVLAVALAGASLTSCGSGEDDDGGRAPATGSSDH